MQETLTQSPVVSGASDGIEAAALRAEAWAGEPFLRRDEDADSALRPGTALRHALDSALAEIESGRPAPSSEWKVRFALMLGLERVLSEKPPHLASGTELRRHQVDALAGMLTELIAANEKPAENGDAARNGAAASDEQVDDEEDEDDDLVAEGDEEAPADLADEEAPDPGAERRYRFRHPTASGKTIAAAGFVEAARIEGVLILTHRRLLVDQFRRELREHGYGQRITTILLGSARPPVPSPITIQTYAWFARHVDEISRDAYQLVICDEAHTALGEKTSAAIRRFSEPIYIGMTATEELIAKQVSDVFPASVDDLPLADAARRGLIAPLRNLRVPPVVYADQLGAHRQRRLRGARARRRPRPRGAEHGCSDALPRALRRFARHRLCRRRRPCLPPRDRIPRRRRKGGGGFRTHAARAACHDPRRLRAGRDRRPHQRAMLLAEGWNSPRATVVMHLAPTASKRVYQQRIPAGSCACTGARRRASSSTSSPRAATHSERVVSLHSLLNADFYRERRPGNAGAAAADCSGAGGAS